MKQLVIILLISIAFVSCEEKISKTEYDCLYDQYVQKCDAIAYLQSECDNIERSIIALRNDISSKRDEITMLNVRINCAQERAKECAEYFEKVYDKEEEFDYNYSKTLIEVLQESIDACR
jgi:chromosome segregation ATPase